MKAGAKEDKGSGEWFPGSFEKRFRVAFFSRKKAEIEKANAF